MPALTHEFSATLPAPPERVFAALTEPASLRQWFSEHAFVEPRVGGAFRFWGKHTYGTPERDDATQTLRRFEPARALAFDWTIDGKPSDVSIELAPGDDGNSTKLTGRHHFDEAPTIGRARELVDDIWRLATGNLTLFVGGSSELLRPDFGDAQPRVELSILIDAPRAQVFRALIEPETLNRWVSSAAKVDARVGGEYGYGWKYKVGERDVQGGPTRIIEFVENERLVTDWPDWRGDPEMAPTTVTWLLEDVGAQTRVTLIHGIFERAADISDYPAGWGYFLGKLKSEVEGKAAAAS